MFWTKKKSRKEADAPVFTEEVKVSEPEQMIQIKEAKETEKETLREEPVMEEYVVKETMICDLLSIDPNVASVLMDIGMHCLYCPASQMETIEQAAMVHGIDPDSLCARINEVIAEDLQLTPTEV